MVYLARPTCYGPFGNKQNVSEFLGARDPATAGQLVWAVLDGQRDKNAGFVLVRDGVQPW